MNIIGILRYTISMLYRKKGFFVLELVMMSLSLCLLNHACIHYYNVYKDIIVLRENMDKDENQVYKIRFGSWGMMNEENGRKIFDFTQKLGDVDGVRLAGKYYVEGIDLSKTEGESTVIFADTLFMDASLLELKHIESSEGIHMALNEGEYTDLIVGDALKDFMPVGSKWEAPSNGRKYIVTGIIKKGETWIATDIISDGKNEICLDNMVVTTCEDEYLQQISAVVSYTFANNVFFTVDENNRDTVLDNVRALAKEQECPITIKTVSQIIDDYKSQYKDVYTTTNLQVFMMLAMTCLGLLMTTLISLYNQRKNIIVMYVYGVSAKEHAIIQGIKCFVMYLIAGCMSYIITFRLTRRWYDLGINYSERIISFGIIFVAAVFLCNSFIACKIVSGFIDRFIQNGEA